MVGACGGAKLLTSWLGSKGVEEEKSHSLIRPPEISGSCIRVHLSKIPLPTNNGTLRHTSLLHRPLENNQYPYYIAGVKHQTIINKVNCEEIHREQMKRNLSGPHK